VSNSRKRLVVFPGTFDPITHGHLDVIRRGARLFDELVVAVGENPQKSAMLSQAQRVRIIRRVVADMGRVRVEPYKGLTVDFARRLGASAILRGIRDTSDLLMEFQMAWTNRRIGGLETVFIMTGPEVAFISSSLVKQIAQGGGDVSALVPPQVLEAMHRTTNKRKRRSASN
jgi:pantetheine-phosphate adenylyltransferase